MDKEKLKKLKKDIEAIIRYADDQEALFDGKINRVHPDHRGSASNLIDYLSLRSFNLSKVQKRLGELGLTRFARAEAHIMNSLHKSVFYLDQLQGRAKAFPKKGLSSKMAERLIRHNTKELLGFRKKGRRVRIMVTMPTTAAEDVNLVHQIAAAGMNCARINCAHDEPAVWKKMIEHIDLASKRLGKTGH